MRALPMVGLFFALTASAPSLGAQSNDDIAAWISLVRSPMGGVVPTPIFRADGVGTSPTFTLGYGTWRIAPGDDETTNLAVSLRLASGAKTVTVDVMRVSVKDCSDCGGLSIGGGAVIPIVFAGLGTADASRSTSGGARFDLAIQPTVSFISFDGSGTSGIAAVVNLPLSLQVPLGGFVIRPFLTPGFGYGRLSDSDNSAGGTRTLIGYGLALANARGTVQVHVGSMQVNLQVNLEDAPSVTGFGLALRF